MRKLIFILGVLLFVISLSVSALDTVTVVLREGVDDYSGCFDTWIRDFKLTNEEQSGASTQIVTINEKMACEE